MKLFVVQTTVHGVFSLLLVAPWAQVHSHWGELKQALYKSLYLCMHVCMYIDCVCVTMHRPHAHYISSQLHIYIM